MIGPGTGVAPFRSFISEMDYLGYAKASLLNLFFGCRYLAKDFHCKDEWKTLSDNGKLTLFCAFSRDQVDKRYNHTNTIHLNVIKLSFKFIYNLMLRNMLI